MTDKVKTFNYTGTDESVLLTGPARIRSIQCYNPHDCNFNAVQLKVKDNADGAGKVIWRRLDLTADQTKGSWGLILETDDELIVEAEDDLDITLSYLVP